VIIVAYHLPLRVERAGDGYNIQWDDERGIDMSGMGLPTRITYVGCIELDVPDQMEQDRLERLLLQTVHEVDDQNGNVAQGASAAAQVAEGFVTGRVYNEQPRYFDLDHSVLFAER
jgi:hypothetical protein